MFCVCVYLHISFCLFHHASKEHKLGLTVPKTDTFHENFTNLNIYSTFILDTVAISISYEDYNMSFSDADNPMFPSPQEIRILEGTKDIRFTCNDVDCLWNISHQSELILSEGTYNIPELTSAFNGNISLKRFTNSNTNYTTAQISIYVIQHEAESNNSTVFIMIIVLLIIFIVTATTIIISVYIFLYVKRHKSTGGLLPKISKAGGDAFPGYVNLGEVNPPEKGYDTNLDYMTIDETSLVTTDTQEKNKPKNTPTQSQSYVEITPTQKREHVEMKKENTYEEYAVMNPQEENCTKLSPNFISIENFPVVYQQYVDSGIGKDSLFSIEFQKLKDHSNQVCILESDDALKLENGQKNPIKNILPFDANRIVLNSPHFDCNYINASYINDYQFIASIHPTKETHQDFLQMIYQTGASLVIMLTTRREKAKMISGVSNRICYWPKKDEPINCEPFVSTLIKSTETNAFVKQDISLKEISTGKEHSFTQCISPIWNEDSTVAEMALAVALLSKIIKHKQDSNNAPVVIHCEDGISKTGIILTVLNAIRDINLRNSVNIFSTVRFLRVQRMSMIPTLVSIFYFNYGPFKRCVTVLRG